MARGGELMGPARCSSEFGDDAGTLACFDGTEDDAKSRKSPQEQQRQFGGGSGKASTYRYEALRCLSRRRRLVRRSIHRALLAQHEQQTAAAAASAVAIAGGARFGGALPLERALSAERRHLFWERVAALVHGVHL